MVSSNEQAPSLLPIHQILPEEFQCPHVVSITCKSAQHAKVAILYKVLKYIYLCYQTHTPAVILPNGAR